MVARKTVHRFLGRTTSHRGALLRNLVGSLFEHESIITTYPKAKEAQRLADKIITMAKKGTEAAKTRAKGIFYLPEEVLPKLFGPIAERYRARPGGYTRVMRIEPKDKSDQAPSAILELVDGPKDIKFALTAKMIAKFRAEGRELGSITVGNIKKVTRFRSGGEEELEKLVKRLESGEGEGERKENEA